MNHWRLSKNSANPPASNVAEDMSTFKFGRRCINNFKYPNKKSILRLRSCASSIINTEYRESVLSPEFQLTESVSHELHPRRPTGIVLESHLVSNLSTQTTSSS
ncbi:hypothetical protein [Rubritalea tangerina]|uniref:hypothetical protein n=1 Tax=Rubritalea tangerina TaxID=430798 RepID=UPI00361B842B